MYLKWLVIVTQYTSDKTLYAEPIQNSTQYKRKTTNNMVNVELVKETVKFAKQNEKDYHIKFKYISEQMAILVDFTIQVPSIADKHKGVTPQQITKKSILQNSLYTVFGQ